MLTPISITEKAFKEINIILDDKEIPGDYGLRVGIKGAGCSGVGFLLGFDKKKDSDKEYDIEGLKVYIDKKHMLYVVGLQIDYYEGEDAAGFSFIMPDQVKTG